MFGLIGEKLSHSYSPQIHSLLGEYDYRLFELQKEDLRGFLERRNFNGINVTIPYKKDVIPYLDEISDEARKMGSVNTIIKRPNGTLFGDSTDYYGFKYTVEKSGAKIRSKKCVVLGSGGASVVVQTVLRDWGASEIIVVSRSGENNYSNLNKHFDAQIIVNTTPVGMYPNCDDSPIYLREFKACEYVFDLIYNPIRTRLILEAEALGIKAVNGLTMLVAQAKRSAELFFGKSIDDSIIEISTEKLKKDSLNIVLLGMPGSGKTTIGKLLAEKMGRDFCDSDTLVFEKCGRTPSEIIENDGETAFRKLESGVLSDICKEKGLIISTGGGCVTVPQNEAYLKENSLVVFINRPLEKLATNGRPLSQGNGRLQELWVSRKELYRAFCDVEIFNDGDICNTCDAILKEFYK